MATPLDRNGATTGPVRFVRCCRRSRVRLFGLLDFGATFDCFDHDILVRRLQPSYGIGASALVWVVSFIVHAFISSRLDYCDSLLTGVGDGVLRKLQSVQNAAARLITDTRKFGHITPVLRDLHWLSVRRRIVFKTAMLVYKCLRGLAPSYVSEFCRPVSTLPDRRQLQSGTTGVLHVPKTRTSIGS